MIRSLKAFLALALAALQLQSEATASVPVNDLADPSANQQAIIDSVAKQLPPHLELASIDIVAESDLPGARVKAKRLDAVVHLIVREPLYASVESAAGAITLAEKNPSGARLKLPAMIVTMPPELPVPPTTRFTLSHESAFGQPRSAFAGSIALQPANAPAVKTQSSPSPSTAAPAAQPIPAANPTSVEGKLAAIAAANGSIFGQLPGPPLQPFELANPSFKGDGVFTATLRRFHAPGEFEIVGTVQQTILRLAAEPADGLETSWSNQYQPPTFLLYPDQQDLTTGNRLLAIPLDPVSNAQLGATFKRTLQPWSDPSEISNFILADAQLWDLNSRSLVSSEWILPADQLRPVKDAPGLFWSDSLSPSASLPIGSLAATVASSKRPFGGETRFMAALQGEAWLAADGVRAVYRENGDFWRAEFDWNTCALRNQSRVTDLGVFGSAVPLAWFGNHFYLDRGRDGGNTPIVKIDLASGNLTEMARPHSFAGRLGHAPSHSSPDGRFIINNHPDGILFVYDLLKEEEFRLSVELQASLYGETQRVLDIPKLWANNHTVVAAYGWFDLAQRRRVLFSELSLGATDLQSFSSYILGLPDDRYIDVLLEKHPASPLPKLESRFRINLQTSEAVPLPPPPTPNLATALYPTWIDTDRYLYLRDSGSLSEVGVWLYTVSSKSSTRLSPLAPLSSAINKGRILGSSFNLHDAPSSPFLVLPERNEVIFVAQKGADASLVLLPLDGSQAITLDPSTTARRLARLDPNPIDLDVSNTWTHHWNHSHYLATSATAAPSTQNLDTLTTRERFIARLLPDERQRSERLLALFDLFYPIIRNRPDLDYWDHNALVRESLKRCENRIAELQSKLSAASEAEKPTLRYDIARLQKGEYHANDIALNDRTINRAAFDRLKIHAILLADAEEIWNSRADLGSDKPAFANFLARRATELSLQTGAIHKFDHATLSRLIEEWKKSPR